MTSWRPGRRAASLSAKVLVVLAALGLWQLLTATGALNRASFPTMWSTLRALGDQLTTSGFWTTIGQTVEGWALGLALGGTAAVLVGSAIGLSRLASRSTAPVIEFLKAVPSIAILPLAIVVLGTHLQMKLTLVGYAVFFPLVIQVVYGVRALDPTVADTATTLQVRGLRRFLVVVLPSAAPFIATGLRISAATALILEIVAELIGGAPGLGQRILLAENAGPTMFPLMYAFVLVTGILGIVLTGMFTLGERRVLHWHESQRNLRGATR
ncbi:MAG: ABC transporter permease [Actinomycetota bacterium]|nr:ABC transporter permease [Actinomycetota bacterium]